MPKPAPQDATFNPAYQPEHPPLRHGEAWQYQCDNGLVLRGEFIECANPTTGTDAPVIHFTHGNGLACRSYQNFLAYLNQHFALFLHDCQGHGQSDNGDPKTQPFVGWNQSAERLLAVISEQQQHGFLQRRKLYGCGHSFGGCLTLLAAAKQPDIFSGLALFDGMIFPPREALALSFISRLSIGRFLPLAKQAKQRRNGWPDCTAAFSYFNGRGMLRTWHTDATYSYLQYALQTDNRGKLELNCPPWMESSIFSQAPKGLWPAIKKLQTPCHLLYGDRSYAFIGKAVQHAVNINHNINQQALAGSHFFLQENPAVLQHHPLWQRWLS